MFASFTHHLSTAFILLNGHSTHGTTFYKVIIERYANIILAICYQTAAMLLATLALKGKHDKVSNFSKGKKPYSEESYAHSVQAKLRDDIRVCPIVEAQWTLFTRQYRSCMNIEAIRSYVNVYHNEALLVRARFPSKAKR
uniref:Uncharacterized protein n=1 Tax=Glossina pallidipes TaxID=7398 RepID=A0A1A9ZX74_GLOPL